MKLLRRFALIMALVMALSSLSGLVVAEEAAPEAAQEAAEEAAQEAAQEDVVLAVLSNGTEIHQHEVDDMVGQIVSYYSQYGYDLSSESMQSVARQIAMETVLQSCYYEAAAKELGLDPLSDEDAKALLDKVTATYEDLISQVYQYYGLQPAEDATDEEKAEARKSAEAILESMGYTFDYIAINERRNFLFDKVNEVITRDLSVTEEAVLSEYTQHVATDEEAYKDNPSGYETMKAYYGYEPYYMPEGFRGITHILLRVDEDVLNTYLDLQNRLEEQAEPVEAAGETAETEPAAEETAETEAAAEETAEAEPTAEETAEAEPTAEPTATPEPVTEAMVEAARLACIASVQDTIDEIHAKLDAGTPWADLVEEYSTDPGMKQEPTRTEGYAVYPDSMMYDAAFVQAAFSIDQIGEVSEPYVGMHGIYIVHYTRDVPAGPVPLTEALRAQIEEELLSGMKNEAIETAFHTWLDGIEIEYTEAGEAYRPVAESEETVEGAEDAEDAAADETAETAEDAEAAATDETAAEESTEPTQAPDAQ